MGKNKPDYFKPLKKKLEKRMEADWDQVSFQVVNYAPILQSPEEKLWSDMAGHPDNDLDSTMLRKFFLYGFGDAGSLEHSAQREEGSGRYIRVQKEIQHALATAYRDLKDSEKKPVVIIAHSLGCQVISNYIWDAQNDQYIFENPKINGEDKLDFVKLKSLRQLMTTGCNIPLFNAGLKKRDCFKQGADMKWDNYYDADDVLGWPIRQLGNSYDFIRDHPINSGGFFKSWNPLSHTVYWEDKQVIKPLANKLQALIDD
jgi:hypothetical protein